MFFRAVVIKGVIQQSLLASIISLYFRRVTTANGDTCIQKRLMRFDGGIVQYYEIIFRGHILF